MMYEGMDDVNDWKPLNSELVVQARKLCIEFFKKMGVTKKVRRDVAKKVGCKDITNKGDTSRPNYRSRLGGREVKYDKRDSISSATPPMETLQFFGSRVCLKGLSLVSFSVALAALTILVFIVVVFLGGGFRYRAPWFDGANEGPCL